MTETHIAQRRFLGGLAATFLPALLQARDEKLGPWRPGCVDIQHLSLGRGVCAFLILPAARR